MKNNNKASKIIMICTIILLTLADIMYIRNIPIRNNEYNELLNTKKKQEQTLKELTKQEKQVESKYDSIEEEYTLVKKERDSVIRKQNVYVAYLKGVKGPYANHYHADINCRWLKKKVNILFFGSEKTTIVQQSIGSLIDEYGTKACPLCCPDIYDLDN